MSDRSPLTPLRPREFFAVPWSGEGEWIASAWLRRFSRRPRRFSFTTSTTWLADDACEWDIASHELIDTVRLRLFGVPIGRMVMRLRPLPAAG